MNGPGELEKLARLLQTVIDKQTVIMKWRVQEELTGRMKHREPKAVLAEMKKRKSSTADPTSKPKAKRQRRKSSPDAGG